MPANAGQEQKVAGLSVTMITLNEAKILKRSLESVGFADEIIVVDACSNDETPHIASSLGAKVIRHAWAGFGQQKNLAITHATGDWILSLDADEVVTPALRQEIAAALSQDKADGFYIPRLAFIGSLKVRHGGWYPDYQLRLVKREWAKFEDKSIHERMVEPPRVSYLQTPMEHYSYQSVSHWVQKMDHYTSLEAEKEPFALSRLLLKPPVIFLRSYIWQSGWRDGTIGFVVAALNAYYKFVVEIKRFERKHEKNRS